MDKTGVGANSFTNPRMRLFSFFFFHSFYFFLFFLFFSFDCVDICAIIQVLLSLCGERKYKNKNHKKKKMKIEKCVCVSFICFISMNFLFSFRPPTECTLNALDFCCFEEKIRGNSNHIPNAFYSQKFPTFPDFQMHNIPSFPKPSGNPKIFGFPSVLKAQWTLKGKSPPFPKFWQNSQCILVRKFHLNPKSLLFLSYLIPNSRQ